MFDRRKETLREFVRGENSSLRELIRTQHEESKRYREEREKYWAERSRYWEEREKHWQKYWEGREKYWEERDKELRELRKAAEAQAEQTREFNREILLRNEKVYTRAIAEMEEGRMQIQANTRAVLSVLDRLEGSGGAAAA